MEPEILGAGSASDLLLEGIGPFSALSSEPVPHDDEVTAVLGHVIHAARVRLQSNESEDPARARAGMTAIRLCSTFHSFEQFEQCIRTLRDAEAASDGRVRLERRRLREQVEALFGSLRFWVMLFGVQRCPC